MPARLSDIDVLVVP